MKSLIKLKEAAVLSGGKPVAKNKKTH